jgi:F-type H+-transporting ATPase subunit a
MTQFLLNIPGGPEVPNLITLINDRYHDMPWAHYLLEWEDIFYSLFVAVLLSIIFHIGSRKREWIPYGLQNFLEWIVENFRNFVVGVLGPDGDKYVTFLGTLFVYILSMNLIGIIPFMKSPTSNINVTIALAICVFVLVQYLNIKNMGVSGFLYHLAGSPKNAVGWIIAPLMFPIEILTQISRPVTLALRLFGNILGEKIMVGFFVVIGTTMLYFFPIQTPFVFMGLLTSVIQAVVFTLLSTIYILLSVPHTDGHQDKH